MVLVVGVGVGQVLPELGILGVQLDGPAQVRNGPGDLAFALQGEADVGVDNGPAQLGRQAEGLGVSGQGLGPTLQGGVGIPQVVVRRRQAGLHAHGLLAVRQALFGLARLDEGLAQVGAGHGQVRVDGDGRAEDLEGLRRTVEIAEHDPQVVPRQGEVGPRAQGGEVRFEGVLAAAEGLEGQAEVVGRLGVLGPELQRGAAAVRPPARAAPACGGPPPSWRGRRRPADGATRPGRSARRPGSSGRIRGASRRTGAGRRRSPARCEQAMIPACGIGVAAGPVQFQGDGQRRVHVRWFFRRGFESVTTARAPRLSPLRGQGPRRELTTWRAARLRIFLGSGGKGAGRGSRGRGVEREPLRRSCSAESGERNSPHREFALRSPLSFLCCDGCGGFRDPHTALFPWLPCMPRRRLPRRPLHGHLDRLIASTGGRGRGGSVTSEPGRRIRAKPDARRVWKPRARRRCSSSRRSHWRLAVCWPDP